MLEMLIAAAMFQGSAEVYDDLPASKDRTELNRLVEPCAALARDAWQNKNTTALDGYLDKLREDRRKNRAELLACWAYLRGVMDASKGNYAAADPAPAPAKPPPAPASKRVERASSSDLCWQDYCPCDPPQGGPDQGICRQLRAGMPVSDQMMAAGAQLRDARQQLADFEAEYGGFEE